MTIDLALVLAGAFCALMGMLVQYKIDRKMLDSARQCRKCGQSE